MVMSSDLVDNNAATATVESWACMAAIDGDGTIPVTPSIHNTDILGNQGLTWISPTQATVGEIQGLEMSIMIPDSTLMM